MKISYFIVNVILFSCAHRKPTTVKGFVILNTNATQVGAGNSSAEDSQDSSDAGPVAVAPQVLVQPLTVIADAPATDNANQSDSSVAEPVAVVPQVLMHPLMLAAGAPVADNANPSDSSVAVPSTEPVSDNNGSLAQPVLSPVITSIDTVDSQSNNVETASNDNLKTDNKSSKLILSSSFKLLQTFYRSMFRNF